MIEFARTHIIGRSAGHSAVRAAAYRSGSRQYDQRNGLSLDYSRRASAVAHSEVMLPEDAPSQLRDRSVLWNEIEFCEDRSNRRASAQLAKDHIIALPRELSLNQQVELARDFAQTYVDQGVGVDLNVHLHSQDNPHAHLMVTTRTIDQYGIGAKARHLNGRFSGGKKLVEAEQLRHRWARFQNEWCKDRDIDLLVTNNDGQWQPELHNGPKTHMAVLDTPLPSRTEVATDRAEAIQTDPSSLIDRVAKQKAVFTAHDLYRELHKHVSDAQQFLTSKAVLDHYLHESGNEKTSSRDKQYFTVRSTLETELDIKRMATQLLKPSRTHNKVTELSRRTVIENDFDFLSDEQKAAVEHITGAQRLSVVIGFAGTGKSSMLKAAAQCWKTRGQRVFGAALAGIAAQGLEDGADIKSSTIHSLLYKLDKDKETLRSSDVVVIDEAGMLDSVLMHKLIQKVNKSGAKIVLVGDAEQLQPIQAGGPLRSISEQGGYCEISTIRRQKSKHDRQATAELAKGNASVALASYRSRGKVHKKETVGEAIDLLVKDTVADFEAGKSMAVLAHANKSVDEINHRVRQSLINKGALKNTATFSAKDKDGKTNVLSIGVGDRILFRKNDTTMGVKNGSLGTVDTAVNGGLKVTLDDGKRVVVDSLDYDEISHGYAMTIHKSQGVTVDQSRVLLSAGWDRHLAYVAMSRHKDDLAVYYGAEHFTKRSINEVIDQSRIQESAIDFAQRHGIDIEEHNGDIKLLDQKPDDAIAQLDNHDKKATELLNKGAVTEAFRHYEKRERVKADNTNDESIDRLVIDAVADIDAGEQVTVLAHTNQAVGRINKKIRSLRIAAGSIKDETVFKTGSDVSIKVGVGDKILFNQDNEKLGISKNTTGVVIGHKNGKLIVSTNSDRIVTFGSREYPSISHGYAVTIHKSKQFDIDRARVLVTNSFNRQVSKLAMSQHKKELTLYYGKKGFKNDSPVETIARERSAGGTSGVSVRQKVIRRGGR